MILVAFPFCLRSSALFGILTISIPFRTAIGLYIRKGTASRGVSDSETAAGGVMEIPPRILVSEQYCRAGSLI